ncbi:MAG: hypothetical protein ACM3P1_08395 [Candidatus Saccharibacteria bacterium]
MTFIYNDTKFIDKRPSEAEASLESSLREVQPIVYSGRFSQVIKELAAEEDFKYLVDEATNYSKAKNRELVLRFAAFYFKGYKAYSSPSVRFLNDTMENYRDITPRNEVELRADFRNSIHIIRHLFGKNAFKRFVPGDEQNKNGKWETDKFHIFLYDILMYSFARQSAFKVLKQKDRIEEALIDLMANDQDFIDSMETTTGNMIFVKARFEKWMHCLQQILEKGTNQPGTFDYMLKFDLYTSNQNCAVCGQTIAVFDDATLHNLPHYWIGDQVIPSGTRLVHRYCKTANQSIHP